MSQSLRSSIGQVTPRVDGISQVCGAAKYVDDYHMEGMFYGRTVRSQIPHGVFESLELDDSFDWSDVYVATADDLPGPNHVALICDDQPALVPIGGTIKHFAEPLAVIAAPTQEKVEAAFLHLSAKVTELIPLFDPQDSLSKKIVIHGEDNILKEIQFARGEQDIEQALAACDLVITGDYQTGAQEQMYIEPQGVVAWWQHETCFVLGSMQCPYFVHRALKELYGLDDDQVVVKQAVTGGGFGGKEEYPSILACHATLMARKVGHPVKMIYDRSEDILATTKRHPAQIRHRLGIMADGTIGAMDVDLLFDGGAYTTLSPSVLSRAVIHACGPYRCPTVNVRGRVVATNHPPHGAFRGFGAPQCTFAYARQMQKAAHKLEIEPEEFHRRNMLRVGDVTVTGQKLMESVASEKVLDAVLQQAREPRPQVPSVGNSSNVARGQGLCFYFQGSGFSGNRESVIKARLSVAAMADGTFEVRSAATDIGQGAQTIFAQLAATELGVQLSSIVICNADSSRVPDSGPTVASRTCMTVGALVQQAAQKVREELQRFAAERPLENSGLSDIAQAYCVEHGELEHFVTFEPDPKLNWDAATFSGDAYPCYGWAACLTEIAVDLDTYEVTVERLIHAIDVGQAINPMIVKGQIEGATLQALGWALCENVVYQNGQIASGRLADNVIPTFVDAPEMETLIVEEPYSSGPHGAKGVGEIPIDGPAAAIANALTDALHRSFDEVPMLPERIAELVNQVGRQGDRT